MSSWRFALKCLCLVGAAAHASAQDYTFSVQLDGVVGIVEKKDSDGKLASLVVLIPYSKSLDVVGISDTNFPNFELNGLPWHVPAVEVDNRNLFGGNAFGTTVVPLLNGFHEISTSCAQTAAPNWDSSGSAADLPAVRVGGSVKDRAVVDPAVLITPPTSQALAARWVFQCGETITIDDAKDNAKHVVPIEIGRLVKQGAWDIEPQTNDKLTLKTVTIKRTVKPDTKIRLDVGNGRIYDLSDFTVYTPESTPTIKLRNVPPDELVTGFHPIHNKEDSTFAHFRLLYGLARADDKKKGPYWVLAPDLPHGDPFCSGQGTLLEK